MTTSGSQTASTPSRDGRDDVAVVMSIRRLAASLIGLMVFSCASATRTAETTPSSTVTDDVIDIPPAFALEGRLLDPKTFVAGFVYDECVSPQDVLNELAFLGSCYDMGGWTPNWSSHAEYDRMGPWGYACPSAALMPVLLRLPCDEWRLPTKREVFGFGPSAAQKLGLALFTDNYAPPGEWPPFQQVRGYGFRWPCFNRGVRVLIVRSLPASTAE